MEASEEKWEPLKDSDQIVWNEGDGYVAYYGSMKSTGGVSGTLGGHFGSRLRQREGIWEKQIMPLQIIAPPNTLGAPVNGTAFKKGERPEKFSFGRPHPMPFLKRMGIVS